jgi:hypothetical protein
MIMIMIVIVIMVRIVLLDLTVNTLDALTDVELAFHFHLGVQVVEVSQLSEVLELGVKGFLPRHVPNRVEITTMKGSREIRVGIALGRTSIRDGSRDTNTDTNALGISLNTLNTRVYRTCIVLLESKGRKRCGLHEK